MTPRRALTLAALCALSTIAACGPILAPRPDPSRFFTLTPIADAGSTPGKLAGRTLGIGPLTLPQYLDRPELVWRVGSNEIRQASFEYWAGSLQKQFTTTLAQNLQVLLEPSQIVLHPWYMGTPPDVAVEIDVVRFELASDGAAHLVARWRLRKGTIVTHAGESKLDRPVAGDTASTVAALSELVGDLSREIANAI
jgi:uncharacterized protein